MKPDLTGTSVLVTGAAGFVGAHLVARLVAQGASVCALTVKGHRTTRLTALGLEKCITVADLMETDEIIGILERCRPDVVFHLAVERNEATLIADPNSSANTGASLIRAVSRYAVKRFVTIGSSLEYPDPVSGSPVGPHGIAKARAMRAMQDASVAVDVPFSGLRTHYVYGPMHGAHKLFPTAIRAAATGAVLSLTGADIRKRFVYVEDIVDACLHVLDLPADPHQVYLASASDQHTNHEAITRIGTLMGKAINIDQAVFAPRDWDRPSWDLPAGTPLLPGWVPKIDLDQGLKASIIAEGYDVCD